MGQCEYESLMTEIQIHNIGQNMDMQEFEQQTDGDEVMAKDVKRSASFPGKL